MNIQLKDSGKTFTLVPSDYIAGGGEGKVYFKGSTAFKIYHDPAKKMFPIGKLYDLAKVKSNYVLGPKDIVLDSNTQIIGFSMPYIENTVFLCWLFNKGYKDQNNVTGDILSKLSQDMRSTTLELHGENIVVGDYNEMNFLTSKKYENVYFIDVDSYQTPNYPCTAIMDTVRDRTVPFGSFSKETDWFGYAIVTFQLWTGIHPYKGKHKDYDRKMVKSLKLMDDNLSVFNKEVTLPKNALPLDIIPTSLKRWYEGVFENKDRSVPPIPGDVAPVLPSKVKIIQSHGIFKVECLHKFDSRIRKARTLNTRTYCITENAVHNIARPSTEVMCRISKNRDYDLVSAIGSYNPILIAGSTGTIEFWMLEKNGAVKIDQTVADSIMIINDNLYTVNDKNIVHHNFSKKFDKIIHSEKVVETIPAIASTVFDGIVISDVFGKCFVAIPYNGDYSTKIHIKPLDNNRIIDAKFVYHESNPVLVTISEYKGKYKRMIFIFDSDMNLKSVRKEDSSSTETSNFTIVQATGTAVMIIEDHTLELFKAQGVRKIDNPPFDSSIKIYNDGTTVLLANNNELLSIKLEQK